MKDKKSDIRKRGTFHQKTIHEEIAEAEAKVILSDRDNQPNKK